MDLYLFYLFGALAVIASFFVIAQRNPIYSAFALIVTLCSLSVVFALLGSPFIAALQVIVYAGAIMVLFLFVLMLLNFRQDPSVLTPGAASVRHPFPGSTSRGSSRSGPCPTRGRSASGSNEVPYS